MVAKKPMKLSVVKVEATLAHKARIIADNKGVPLSTYVSSALGAAVARDWPKVLRKLVDEGGEE